MEGVGISFSCDWAVKRYRQMLASPHHLKRPIYAANSRRSIHQINSRERLIMPRYLIIIALFLFYLIQPSFSDARDENEQFLEVFYKYYFSPRSINGYQNIEPVQFWNIEETIINGSKGIINIRSGLGVTSTALDRFVGFVLAAPQSLSSLRDMVGVLASISESRGLLNDLGLMDDLKNTAWINGIVSNIGWIYTAKDIKGGLDVLAAVHSFQDINKLAGDGFKAADAVKLSNFRMAGIGIADFVLDKTLVAQVRSTLKLDRLKLLLLASRATSANEIKRLYDKADRKDLSWQEAFALMHLENQYFARKAESYFLDTLYWQDQLNPTVGRIPYTKKTLMDLLPGYDNPQDEQKNLAFALRQKERTEWHLEMCRRYLDDVVNRYESSLIAQSKQPPLPPVKYNMPFFVESQWEDFKFTLHTEDGENPLMLFDLLNAFVPNASLLMTEGIYNFDYQRRYQALWLNIPISDRLKEYADRNDVRWSEKDNAYRFVPPTGSGRQLFENLTIGSDEFEDIWEYISYTYMYMGILAVYQINLDEDSQREFIFITYMNKEEIPLFQASYDRHDIWVLDYAGTEEWRTIWNIDHKEFRASRFNRLDVRDINGDSKPEISIHFYHGSHESCVYTLKDSRLVRLH